MPVRVPLGDGGTLVQATFLARPNQLLVEAVLDGRVVRAHMADRGRLDGLLRPNARMLLTPRNELGRKTAFQVVGVYEGDELVSLDTHLPNRLVAAGLAASAFPQFSRYSRVQAEVSVGPHRFDFRLGDGPTACLLEVKSVGMVAGGLAMFPDAPTERGRKHVEALTTIARNGQRAAVVFIIQRSRARAMVPNELIDPAFSRALRQAVVAGMEVYAYLCPVTPEGLTLGQPVPVFGSANAALV
ncbi:MAG: DNA/RNA nuclease SfsA [Chloroflexaceae bacterium]|nr:DNA/RNA nuclease SfsA [Chloroflexaceae bacterium]